MTPPAIIRQGAGAAPAAGERYDSLYLKYRSGQGSLASGSPDGSEATLRVACLGGGPAGLYFAIAMKLRDARHEIVVVERNRPYDTFGWGVVLSDETLANLKAADPVSAAEIARGFVYWDDIATHYRGTVTRSSGHGFCGIGRKRLLNILQDRARALGVELQFETEIDGLEPYRGYDLIVAADGVNSKVRSALAHVFRPDIDVRRTKYIWLGTHQKFDDAFTFIFEETDKGWIWAHAYQFEPETATFIVECSEATWRNLGFDGMSQEETLAACERIFARNLGGNRLMTNARHLRGSAWLNFNRVLCDAWSHENIVLMGDAAATAHFSVGSGTKLALESAIALADYLHTEPTMAAAFRRYEEDRRTQVLRLQSAARNSTEWFEDVERYFDLHPVQFNYSLLTRSQRISHENLRQRDKAWLEGAEMWFEEQATGRQAQRRASADVHAVPPARDAPQEPRGGLADGAIQGRGRHADRLAPRASRRARQGRRRPRRHGDDLRVARGAHHARLHRPLCAGARGRLEAHRRLRARRDRRQDRHPARPLRPQGLHPARLGGDGCAADDRQLGADGALAGPVVAAQPGAARDDARRHGPGAARVTSRRPAWPSAPASTCWSCTTPTAICCRRSSRRSPTGGATSTAARWRTACASRWRSIGRCARCGPRRSPSRCASPPTTGWAATASRPPMPWRSRAS